MRYVLLSLVSLFITISTLKADYLYKEKNRCVVFFVYDQDKGEIIYQYSDEDDNRTTTETATFLPGYLYDDDNSQCKIPDYIQELSLQPDDYNFLLALSGVFAGFTFLFFSIFIFIDITKKKC